MKEIRSWSGLVIKKTRKVRGEGRREATKFGEKLIELSKEADQKENEEYRIIFIK